MKTKKEAEELAKVLRRRLAPTIAGRHLRYKVEIRGNGEDGFYYSVFLWRDTYIYNIGFVQELIAAVNSDVRASHLFKSHNVWWISREFSTKNRFLSIRTCLYPKLPGRKGRAKTAPSPGKPGKIA